MSRRHDPILRSRGATGTRSLSDSLLIRVPTFASDPFAAMLQLAPLAGGAQPHVFARNRPPSSQARNSSLLPQRRFVPILRLPDWRPAPLEQANGRSGRERDDTHVESPPLEARSCRDHIGSSGYRRTGAGRVTIEDRHRCPEWGAASFRRRHGLSTFCAQHDRAGLQPPRRGFQRVFSASPARCCQGCARRPACTCRVYPRSCASRGVSAIVGQLEPRDADSNLRRIAERRWRWNMWHAAASTGLHSQPGRIALTYRVVIPTSVPPPSSDRSV